MYNYKRLTALILGIMLLAVTTATAMQHNKATADGKAMANNNTCKYCGMSLNMQGLIKLELTYHDDSQTHTCSLYCAALDLSAKSGESPRMIKVADYDSDKMVNARAAYWVLGGRGNTSIKGAFHDKSSAKEFIEEFSGKLVGFDDALKVMQSSIIRGSGGGISDKMRMKIKNKMKGNM